MAFEAEIRAQATRLGVIADTFTVFDQELNDPDVSPEGKTYLRGRLRTKLQPVIDALDALVRSVP